MRRPGNTLLELPLRKGWCTSTISGFSITDVRIRWWLSLRLRVHKREDFGEWVRLLRRGAFADFFLAGLFVVFYRGFWEKGVAERGVLMVSLWWNVW